MFFYTLDKVVCPFLLDAFGQDILHSRSVAELDKLIHAKVPLILEYLHPVHMPYNALPLQLP